MSNARSPLLGLILLGITSWAVAAETTDQRFLAGLHQRGLYRLAESYCLDRLAQPGISARRRSDLVIELSRSLAQQAVGLPPDSREPLWQRAAQVTEDFARQYPADPRLLPVRLQAALAVLTRGELARQEAEVSARRADLIDEAQIRLREAVRLLGELADEVERQRRQQNLSRRSEPDRLSADELTSLQNTLQYELSRAYRNQALCYASDSPDRSNALTQAVELLDWLVKLDPNDALGWSLAWKSRLDLIKCYRLLGNPDVARRQLEALRALKPPASVELRARAERIRLALATDQLADAVAALAEGRQIEAVVSPELDFAWLDTYLTAWRESLDANNRPQADAWQTKATEMVSRIENLHGPYWTRRAEMRLAAYVRTLAGSADLETLARAAASSFRSGQLDEAVAAYDRARQFATTAGNTDRAFDLGYLAATIEHQRNRHEEALARFRQIALTMPEHAKAPEAHLLAVYHAGQIAKSDPANQLDRYVALLQEHLEGWPHGPTAGQAWWQLGRLSEYRRDWDAAIQAYQAVSAEDAEYFQAVEAIDRCCRTWFDRRRAAGEPVEQIADKAARWFESLTFDASGARVQQWGELERLAALAAARLWLGYTSAGFDQSQDLLSAALSGSADPPTEWKSNAEALLVFSLAGRGRRREAGDLLARISAGPPDALLEMLEGLGRMARSAKPSVRAELAQLQLTAIDLLRSGGATLEPSQQAALEKVRAEALAGVGQVDEALAAYQVLAAAAPHDGTIQEAYAELLLNQRDPASLKKAMAKWRELEDRSPKGSPRWFRAKYSVAWLHCQSGNKQQTAKMITLLKLLHPELGGPEMKAKFDKLLARCRP
ncbi:MAG: hypothetical protein V3R99_06035 [Thermoguttaceae bacterium]